jgi:hypothetical protein
MRRSSPFLATAALGLLAAAVAVGLPRPADVPPAAQPARADAPLPTALTFVPHDAALFLHADVAAIWNSDLLKTFRTAEPTPFAALDAEFAKRPR